MILLLGLNINCCYIKLLLHKVTYNINIIHNVIRPTHLMLLHIVNVIITYVMLLHIVIYT